ncbi:MAG: MOSC domain-containing protein [Syntrophomonadales bacterium]|jgi:MOSC domain-containing protein YiiM
MEGRILAVCTSEEKGEKKSDIGQAMLVAEHGLEGDAHAGPWHRQVSLLSLSSVEKMRNRGIEIGFGDFAENLTVEGLDVWSLPIGTRLVVGTGVELEVTQIGKECHRGCAIRQQVGDCVMPREGIFARVLKGGMVRVGDPITVGNT